MAEELEPTGSAGDLGAPQHVPVAASDGQDETTTWLRRQWSQHPIRVGLLALVVIGVLLVIPTLAFHWSFAEYIGIAALLVSILGFAVAIAEIQRTESVAYATQEAVAAERHRARVEQLKVAITELPHLTRAIEIACSQDQLQSFEFLSNSWRRQAVNAKTLFARLPGGYEQMIESLDDAVRLGRETETAVQRKPTDMLATAENFINLIKEISDELPFVAEVLPPADGLT